MLTEQVLEAMRNLYKACRDAGWTDTQFCAQFNVTKLWICQYLERPEKN